MRGFWVAVLLLCPATASAGGFHVTVVGVRRTAMLANIAAPDDLTALYVNPAGLGDQPGLHLYTSAGLSLLSTGMQLDALDGDRFPEINAGCGDPKTDASCPWPIGADGRYTKLIEPERAFGVIPYLGASHDLGFVGLRDVVVSVAVYAPGAYGASLPADAPTAYSVIDGLFVIGAATLGFGWRINDTVSVGASASFNQRYLGFSQKMSLVDALTARGQSPVDSDPVPELAERLIGDLQLDFGGSDAGAGFGLGVLVRPFAGLRLGASFSGFTSASFEGEVEIRGLGTRGGAAPSEPDALRILVAELGYKLPESLRVEMPIPPAILTGVVYSVTPTVEIGFDARFWLYSLFTRQVIAPIYAEGPGTEPIDEDSLSRDKGYHTSYELSGGVRWVATDALELMAGLAFDHSPVPDRSFSIDNPSLDVMTFGAGARIQLGDTFRLGASYMFLVHFPREISDSGTSPPTNGRVSATSHIPTLELSVAL